MKLVEKQKLTIKLKTLPKRHTTNKEGVYYKEVEQTTLDENGKVIDIKISDKIYLIRYWDNKNQRFITLGKHSAGIRIQYCVNKRNEFINLSTNNELPPQITKRIQIDVITLDSIAYEHYNTKSKHNRSNHALKRMYENHIQPSIGDKDIFSITFENIENLQTDLANKYSNKSVNNYLGELSSIYTTAIKKGIIVTNPMKRITRLKIDNIRDRYLKKNEVEMLIKAVEDDEQLLTFVLISLYTGARLGAVCLINESHIDFDLGRITMRDEKNFEDYYCHLNNQRLIDLLKKRITVVNKNEPLVFDGLTVNNLKDRIKRRLGSVLNKLFNDENTTDKQKVVPHTLRHTFASNLAINGVSIYTIKSLLNHSDINQTMRYAKLAPDRGEQDIQRLYI